MKKKLPILHKPTPASAQTELAARPVTAGSTPAFPKRDSLYRSAGLFGAGVLLAGGIAGADPKAPPQPQKPTAGSGAVPPAPDNGEGQYKMQKVETDPALLNGAVDGKAIDLKKAPTFKVYRDGGGIGPPEDMWEPTEVEAFINWTMAKEGKLQLKSHYALSFDGVSITLDGFDEKTKQGYVYTDKLDDQPNLSKETKAKFDAWIKAKKVAILVIEQKKNPDQATLKGKIVKFLADNAKAPMNSDPLTPPAPPPAPPATTPTTPAKK